MRRTKLLITLGPASESSGILRRLVRRVDAVRINFSHGESAAHRRMIRAARASAERVGKEIAVVADLQGPKIRIGELADPPWNLSEGSRFTLRQGLAIGKGRDIPLTLPGSLSAAARAGDPLLLGDGQVSLRVERVEPTSLVARVIHPGALASHAGIYLPRARLRTEILGRKDRADLEVALAAGVDYIALSFVRSADEIRQAREWIRRRTSRTPPAIIAKIERAEALRSFDEILDASDGIMVARGDLGIEVPLERLPLEQKSLLARINSAGKFGIVATQMLLSMVREPRPTRAEATDVANAILDGADALMLSEESAVGRYPVEAVEWLDRIARATEPAVDRARFLERPRAGGSGAVELGVAETAVRLAERLGASSIVAPTHSGRTARLVAAFRPQASVLAPTAQRDTARRLALVWGVSAVRVPAHLPLEKLRDWARDAAGGSSRPRGQGPVVLTAGYPVEGRPTNLVTVVDSPENAPRHRRPRSGRRLERGSE
jgi:pyruvate kinase